VKNFLLINRLKVCIEDKPILNGVDLVVNVGEIHVIMGPNGSGKSTLAFTLMGHPKYKIFGGEIIFWEKDLKNLSADKRAKLGMFLAFQYPHEVEGVTLFDFLRVSYDSLYKGGEKDLSLKDFRGLAYEKCKLLKIKEEFLERDLNLGFSGGEKKLSEILQLAVLQPKLAILDEIDSGLDIDALKNVCNAINVLKAASPKISFLLITHYQRILKYVLPDFVHVMKEGKIVKSGDKNLAGELEKVGYQV